MMNCFFYFQIWIIILFWFWLSFLAFFVLLTSGSNKSSGFTLSSIFSISLNKGSIFRSWAKLTSFHEYKLIQICHFRNRFSNRIFLQLFTVHFPNFSCNLLISSTFTIRMYYTTNAHKKTVNKAFYAYLYNLFSKVFSVPSLNLQEAISIAASLL